MDSLLPMLVGLESWLVYGALALLVFGESAGAVALLLPGELALLAGGALAAQGYVFLPLVIAIAVVAAVAGHAAGYYLGHRFGTALLHRRPFRRYAGAVDNAAELVSRHGPVAVLLGRWMNVGRVVVPMLAGAGRMRFATFTMFNVLGGLAWVVCFVLLGHAAGASVHLIAQRMGHASWWLTGVAVLAVAAVWGLRRRRTRRRNSAGEVPPEGRCGGTVRATESASASTTSCSKSPLSKP